MGKSGIDSLPIWHRRRHENKQGGNKVLQGRASLESSKRWVGMCIKNMGAPPAKAYGERSVLWPRLPSGPRKTSRGLTMQDWNTNVIHAFRWLGKKNKRRQALRKKKEKEKKRKAILALYFLHRRVHTLQSTNARGYSGEFTITVTRVPFPRNEATDDHQLRPSNRGAPLHKLKSTRLADTHT